MCVSLLFVVFVCVCVSLYLSLSLWSHCHKCLCQLHVCVFASAFGVCLSVSLPLPPPLSLFQEHVSEYGVHWNFFFTLGAVALLSALWSPPPAYCAAAGLLILTCMYVCAS